MLKALEETDDLMKITEEGLLCIIDHGTCHYACETCGRLFYEKESLKTHIRENHHDQRKQWHCRYCNKAFNRDNNKLHHEEHCEHGAGKKHTYLNFLKLPWNLSR